MKLKTHIPIFSLENSSKRGWEISKYSKEDNVDLIFKAVHRDDHYIFIFQQKGKSRIMIDFDTVSIDDAAVLCILPGQAHQGILAHHVEAWFLAVKPEMVKDSYRHFFVNQDSDPRLAAFGIQESKHLSQMMKLLTSLSDLHDENYYKEEVNRSLINACLGMIISEFQTLSPARYQNTSRSATITRLFRCLLLQAFKTMKTPAGYAAALHISPTYLNEVVKKNTGFSVSYWIHQEIILEAKRKLFYTDSSVKEIAEQLGYEDYSYFTRVFTRVSGISPIAFRQKYRESS